MALAAATSPVSPLAAVRLAQRLEPAARGLEKFCKWFSAAGMIIFMLMVALTFADVFLRYFFHNSVNGTVERTELLMVVVVFSSLAYTQWTKNHVVMALMMNMAGITPPFGINLFVMQGLADVPLSVMYRPPCPLWRRWA